MKGAESSLRTSKWGDLYFDFTARLIKKKGLLFSELLNFVDSPVIVEDMVSALEGVKIE